MKLIQPIILSSLMVAGSLQAAVVITVTDVTPLTGDPNNGPPNSFTGTTTPGIFASANEIPGELPNLGYTLTGADLTSLGATEFGGAGTGVIQFQVAFTQTGGSAVQESATSGKVSVTGGNSNRIDDGETLTATIAGISIIGYDGIDGSDLSIGFTYAQLSNVTGTLDITHEAGTVATTTDATFDTSSFFTITSGAGEIAALNAYTIEITAVPEPSAAALLGGLCMLALLRRRR
ncbi:PEP-CTERM sorting domain-containing protein [Haloferula sp. A504]|uniref:PEP-CTERM sorting domain-containing protein n=1 Tax=Haloferula sp. A504 TaxID=3373601 RepID=UPI0031BF8E99|nr:PEP-CTERM sorting domain-containing protein [Verrucomicrobiaceae bacterium E54]